MNILIVEDDTGIRDMLADLLDEEGHTVLTAQNGAEALHLLSQLDTLPSIILLDLMMPVMTGWQFCEAIAGDPVLRRIPILILSAVSNLQERVQNLSTAAALPKPIEFSQLLTMIQHLSTNREGAA